jgi:cytochrome P450
MRVDVSTQDREEGIDSAPSLFELLDDEVLADPYPLYRRLFQRGPVLWDPFLHAWVVTGYPECVTVLHRFSANRTPTPEQVDSMGMKALAPLARVMTKQMLFLDPPAHTTLRKLASAAFTPRRVEAMGAHIAEIAERLVDDVVDDGAMDVVGDFAAPFPAIVTAELLGVPTQDHRDLKKWSADFSGMLGNFQHNPDLAERALESVQRMTEYFDAEIRLQEKRPREGLIHAFMTAEIDGSRLSRDEIIANIIVTMVGGQETTTNLIGNGLLTLLRNPPALARMRDDETVRESGVEELLRYESPSQHTARIAPSDIELGGKTIHQRDAVIAVMAAANRDPRRFSDPDRLDLAREDNRHLAFGWAAHFCFGAPLARLEGQIAFNVLLKRLTNLRLADSKLEWRENLGLRGLEHLPVLYG